MNISVLGRTCLIAAVSWSLLAAVSATPPTNEKRTVVITFEDGSSKNVSSYDDLFAAIPVVSGEIVTIQAPVPKQLTKTPPFAQALDGGAVSAVTVSSDGIASVQFQVGNQPGQYRLLVSARGKSATLQFEVAPQE